MKSTYNYVNGICGSGKTFTAIKKIAARVKSGETIIYTTETIRLLKQTQKDLEELGVETCLIKSQEQIDWKGFYSELIQETKDALESTNDQLALVSAAIKSHQLNYSTMERNEQNDWRKEFSSVAQSILEKVEQPDANPRVILCTTKSLIRAAANIRKDVKLSLYIDEGFVVVDSGEYISATYGEVSGIAAKLKLSDSKPDDLSTNNRYQLPEKLKLLEQYIKSELYEVEYESSKAKLNWVAYLNIKSLASHFSEITLLAACHEDTLQYHAIKASGCQQKVLDWGLANKHYTDGVVHVYWVLQDREWRTTFKDKLSSQQLENIGMSFEQCHMSNEALTVKGISGYGKALPVKSHGFNDISDNHHFLNLHTQMPANYCSKFLKETYGMTSKQIRQAYYHYDCYQAAMRVSLRNSSKSKPSTKDNYFCFGDKATAQYFISKLSSQMNINQGKLTVYRPDEETRQWVVEELDKKKARSDKVSENKSEQKNRSKDKRRLLELKPDFKDLNGAQGFLKDWRKDNKGRRVAQVQLDEAIKLFG